MSRLSSPASRADAGLAQAQVSSLQQELSARGSACSSLASSLTSEQAARGSLEQRLRCIEGELHECEHHRQACTCQVGPTGPAVHSTAQWQGRGGLQLLPGTLMWPAPAQWGGRDALCPQPPAGSAEARLLLLQNCTAKRGRQPRSTSAPRRFVTGDPAEPTAFWHQERAGPFTRQHSVRAPSASSPAMTLACSRRCRQAIKPLKYHRLRLHAAGSAGSVRQLPQPSVGQGPCCARWRALPGLLTLRVWARSQGSCCSPRPA